MIHETMGGGLLGAILIFGGMWAAIVGGASIALVLIAKNIGKLQAKSEVPESGDAA